MTKNQLFKTLNSFHVKNSTIASKERVLSIDALRGFDMFWIMGGEMFFIALDKVFQNRLSGWMKTQMDHVDWLGFHFYDIIMPLFIFLVGVSMVYSYRKRLSAENSHKALWLHTIKRIAILWILGMVVQGNLLSYDINQIKLYSNTLQAIASGYLIATLLVLYLPVTGQILATLGLLFAYWAIVALVPFEGSINGHYLPNSNIANYFDQIVLGRFDDGLEYSWIISSLNFGASTMLGVFSGYLMQANTDKMKKFYRFVAFGAALIIVALIWDLGHPIIKKIWTSSFVLYAGGLSVLLLAIFYLVIDVWKVRKDTDWMIVLGANAIFGYVAWHLFSGSFMDIAKVFLNGLKDILGKNFEAAVYFGGFMVIYLLMKYMYKNKTFIKI
jgi:predicted acyltransferase